MGFIKDNIDCIKYSSKCIIWVGGKVCAIDICNGDTIEDVIKKLGKAIFGIEKEIDIQDIDFSSLLAEKECPPKGIKDLLQLIINKIESCCSESTTVSNNTVLTVIPASCFTEALGTEPISSITYLEYLGETVCSQNQEIVNLKESLAQLRDLVNGLSEQVETLIGG